MKRLALFGLFLVVSICSVLYLQDMFSNKLQSQIIKTTSASRKLFLGARKKTVEKSIVVSDAHSGCSELKDNLEVIDFNFPAEEWVQQFDLEKFKDCKSPAYQARLENIQAVCFTKFDESNCSQEAVFLRALLRTEGVTDTEDRDVLADLILKEFANHTPNFEKLTEYSEKLLNYDPDQPAIQKLWASSNVMSMMDKGKSPMEVAEEIKNRISEEVWNDSDLQGIKLATTTGFQPDSVEEYARGYLSQKSDSRMHEILGWSLWKQNKIGEAIQQLERAIALNPQDKWLRDQLKRVNSKDANSDTYQARISLGINLRDLYN